VALQATRDAVVLHQSPRSSAILPPMSYAADRFGSGISLFPLERSGEDTVERVTWSWIIKGLDDALDFCRSLGLVRRVEASRFQEHRACLAQLAAALTTGGQETARAVFEANRLQAVTALTEGAELMSPVYLGDRSHFGELSTCVSP